MGSACKATTRKGLPCKLNAKQGDFCHHHVPGIECGICLNVVKKNTTTLKCNHCFCTKCINTWMCKSPVNPFRCPMCRDVIDKEISLEAWRWGVKERLIVKLTTFCYSIYNLDEEEYNEVSDIIEPVLNLHMDAEMLTNFMYFFTNSNKQRLFYKLTMISTVKLTMCQASRRPSNDTTYLITNSH